MDAAIIAGFAGSVLPRLGSGSFGAGGGTVSRGECGDRSSLGTVLADAGID